MPYSCMYGMNLTSHRDVYGDAEDLRCLLITKWEIAEPESCGDAVFETRSLNMSRFLRLCDVHIPPSPLPSRRIRFSQLLCCIVTYER